MYLCSNCEQDPFPDLVDFLVQTQDIHWEDPTIPIRYNDANKEH